MAKKALCVGINNYKNYPENALNGCINDANDMKTILIKYMDFLDEDIIKLIDAKATRANIMKNLQEIVEGAKKGKYNSLVFSMSSHGTQIPDTNGDEPDKVDEAFCPYDLAVKGDSWDPHHIITDDELHDLFTQLPENVSLEVYLDTCHSGTGLKAMEPLPNRQARYIPPPSIKPFQEMVGKIFKRLEKPFFKDITTARILWAACKADQTSADANIDGNWHGAFTYYLCKEIKTSQNKLSRNEILKKITTDLKTGEYSQEPQLECDATSREKSIGF